MNIHNSLDIIVYKKWTSNLILYFTSYDCVLLWMDEILHHPRNPGMIPL